MDGVFTWDYYSLINELTQGMEHTKQLRTYLSSVASTSEPTPELLLQKILSSYEQSLIILKWSGSTAPSLPAAGAIESMVSGDGSARNDGKKKSFKDHQKIIHISKKRSYYRCINRHTQNCQATKEVQRSDDDPTVFDIIYKGSHTCQLDTNSTLQATSPEIQASHHSLIVGGFPPSFVSPTTPESNYFSVSSFQMNGLGIIHNLDHSESYLSDIGIFRELRHSDSDRTDTFSANTSTTSSSIGGQFARLSGAGPDFSIWTKQHPQTEAKTPKKDDKDE